MIPLHISLKQKLVIVAGGGKIAYRRLQLLLEEGANITVVSPEAIPEIKELFSKGKIKWLKKKIDLSDLKQAFMVVAATNDPVINEWIAEHADSNQLVNIASNAGKGNVIVPKYVKKGRLTLSVSTNGASPKLAKEICEQLSAQFDQHFIEKLDNMYEQRVKKKQNK